MHVDAMTYIRDLENVGNYTDARRKHCFSLSVYTMGNCIDGNNSKRKENKNEKIQAKYARSCCKVMWDATNRFCKKVFEMSLIENVFVWLCLYYVYSTRDEYLQEKTTLFIFVDKLSNTCFFCNRWDVEKVQVWFGVMGFLYEWREINVLVEYFSVVQLFTANPQNEKWYTLMLCLWTACWCRGRGGGGLSWKPDSNIWSKRRLKIW